MRKLVFIIVTLFANLACFAQNDLFPIRLNSKWGFIDKTGKVIIEPKYLAVGKFGTNEYTHFAKYNALGIVKRTGEELLFENINRLKVIDNQSIAIRKDTLWGIVNFNKDTLLKPLYSEIQKDKKSCYKVRFSDSIGIKTPMGKTLVPMRYKLVKRVNNDGFYAETIDSSFIFSESGQKLYEGTLGCFEYKYWPIIVFREDSNRINLLNVKSGIKATELLNAKAVAKNLFVTRKNDEWHLFNGNTGNVYTRKQLFTIDTLSNDFLRVHENNFTGIIKKEGTIIVPTEYNAIELNNGSFHVRKGNLVGVYSPSGKLMLKPIYDLITPYSGNLLLLQQSGKLGMAKTNGTLLFAPMFDALEVDNKQIRGKNGTEMGFIDLDKNYDVVDFYKFKNVKTISLDTDFPVLPQETATNTTAPNFFGWFFSNGIRKWGFRRQDSSLRHTPTFYNIKHFPQTGFTVTWQTKKGDASIDILDGSYYQDYKCALALTADGNYFLNPKYWHIYQSELKKKNCGYVRALRFDGKQQIIQRNGLVVKKSFDFIDTLVEGLARYNIGGSTAVRQNPKSKTIVCNQMVFKHQIGKDSSAYSLWQKNALKKKFIELDYGKWGFINNEGNIAIDHKFDFVNQFYKGTSIVKYQGKWGVINTSGEFIISPEYFNVERLEHNGKLFFQVFKTEPKFGIIDSAGNTRIYPEFKKADNYQRGLVAVKSKKGWTFLDSNLFPIHDPIFDEVKSFSNNRCAVSVNKKWGYINRFGTAIIPFAYNKVLPFHNNRAWVFDKGKWYLINEKGVRVTSTDFSNPVEFRKGFAFAKKRKSDKYSLLNKSGENVIKKRFDDALPFNEYAITPVEKKNRWAIIDTTGLLLTDFTFHKIDSFKNGWARATDDLGSILLHYSGRTVRINPDYYEFSEFCNGLARVKYEGNFGFIDTTGKVFLDFEYRYASNFYNGYAFVKKSNGISNCINKNGEVVFEYQGFIVEPFIEGRAILKKQGKYFYIDTLGRNIFDEGFKKALPFSENVGRVKIGKKWAVINEHGHVLNTPKYVKIKNFNCQYSVVKRSGSYGLYNDEGGVVLNVMYDEMILSDGKQFFLSVQDKIGHYDLEDEWIWEPAR